jgi:hypothetical protein
MKFISQFQIVSALAGFTNILSETGLMFHRNPDYEELSLEAFPDFFNCTYFCCTLNSVNNYLT